MKNEVHGKEFPIAQKIYGALLRAYPPAHRAEYGAAMMQLFRDQCRDAWGESKHFGLLKLWLRVLPDWASTSIMERLAALNERKTMNEKLANLGSFQTPPAKIFSRVFVVVFLIIFIASVAVTFILPETYASTSEMLIRTRQSILTQTLTYDPYLLQTEMEKTTSEAVLVPVIENLKLNELWGKRYSSGEKLTTGQSLALLHQRLAVRPVRNSMAMSIQVFSEDKNEAAEIANAIMYSYVNYKVEAQKQLAQPKLDAWRGKIEKIKNTSLNDAEKQKLIGDLNLDIQANGLAAIKPGDVVNVQMIRRATPEKIPTRPNKPQNIALGGFFGFLLASAVGGVAFFISKSRQRNRAAVALVGS